MVTEEPIVVNEPKELQVPEFNKKEVVNIVNDGISKGQVNLPAGGTKWYYHIVKFGAAIYNSESIYFISTKKEYKQEDFTFSNLIQDLSLTFTARNICMIGSTNSGSAIRKIGEDSGTVFFSDFLFSSITSATYFTDTVTEL